MRLPGSRAVFAWASAIMLAPALCLAAAQSQSVTYAYDALGRITQATYQNGAVATYTYDAAGSMVAVQVTAASNAPPVAVNDTTSTSINTPKTFDPRANDTDPEGGALTIVSVTTPSSGSAVVMGGGTGLIYTPANNFTGTATFSYTVRDPQNATATATVTVTVAGAPNSPPNAVNDVVNTDGPANEVFEVEIDVLANDSDLNFDALTVISVTQPSGGQGSTYIANNAVVYSSLFSNTFANFSYTISDGRGGTATANVALQISRY
jgi:YD repeat-containing protein